jgi:murein DD-endopeptidase MepM/ murein hydrolase activator NlpD
MVIDVTSEEFAQYDTRVGGRVVKLHHSSCSHSGPRITVQPDFRVPLSGGQRWSVTTQAGGRTSVSPGFTPTHTGTSYYSIDFDDHTNIGQQTDVPVLAAADGVISEIGQPTAADLAKGYGNYVKLQHPKGFTSLYGHLRTGSVISLAKGACVKRGMVLGKIGTTGASSGTHLHFEVRYNDKGHLESAVLDELTVDGLRLRDYRIRNDYPSTNRALQGTDC